MNAKKRSVCPIACALDVLGDKWTLLIVRDLACGKRRFSDFSRSPEKIATNILAARLERLIAEGLVEKYADDEEPWPQLYRLTAKGKALGPTLTALAEWGLAHVEGTSARMKPRFD